MTTIELLASVYMIIVTGIAYLFSKEIDKLEKSNEEMMAAMFKMKEEMDYIRGIMKNEGKTKDRV